MADKLDDLKNRLIAKFPPPYPTEVSVIHHKCGGKISRTVSWSELNLWCVKCRKEWTDKEADAALGDFTGRDETEYKLVLQSNPTDEWGNKQTRAFHYLKVVQEG